MTNDGSPRSARAKSEVVKTPVPIALAMTSAIAPRYPRSFFLPRPGRRQGATAPSEPDA